MSLDGYVAEAGNFDWAVPDEEVHAFVNDLERPVGGKQSLPRDVRLNLELMDERRFRIGMVYLRDRARA